MSRTRIVGGKITEIVGGNYSIYAKESIIYNAATTITETAEGGISFGEPKDPPSISSAFEYFVTEIYFGKKVITPIFEDADEIITALKGTTEKKIRAKFIKDKNIKKADIVSYSTNIAFVKAKGGEKVTITYKKKVKDKISFTKVTKTKIKQKIWIVAKCSGFGFEGKLSVEINENKLTNPEAVYDNSVTFLVGDAEQTKVEFDLVKDKIEEPNIFAKEVTLQPKSKEDVKKLIAKFDKRTNKNAFLYLKGELKDTTSIKFLDGISEYKNVDGERLEVFYCDCGEKYKNDIECTRYGTTYGPVYWGKLSLKNFSKWDDLINDNTVTEDEKSILIAMSENEGNLDAVQSYDSEILTAGAMQKTINPNGYGELPIQIWEFKIDYPDKYILYLENCNWEIEKEEIEKNDNNGNVTKIYKYKAKYNNLTGKELKNKIREGFDKTKFKTKVESEPIEPIIKLMNDVDYQIKQIKDFVKRLNSSLNKKPTSYTNKISSFTTSNLGKATVLDNDVNRPGQVSNCFGKALDNFFTKNPRVSKDPSEWGNDFSKYETEILEIYGPLRGEGDFSMTSATKRYNDLKTKL